jgi:hypothetical protein
MNSGSTTDCQACKYNQYWISQETAVPPCAGNKRENVLIHA